MSTIIRKYNSVLRSTLRSNGRAFSTTQVSFNVDREDPIKRTFRILNNDMKTVKSWFTGETPQHKKSDVFPTHCDVVIIGGGAIGSSIAYWLKERAGIGLNVVVVEKDPTYKEASTALSVGGIRQQFSMPENISMSLFGAEFLREIKTYLKQDIDVSYIPNGYLSLASEAGAEQLKTNFNLQKELGARHELLTAKRLKERFPWLNVEGVELGCHGLENEGWFDPWALLYGFKKSAIDLGVQYVQGEASGFEFKHMPEMMTIGVEPGTYEAIERLLVKTPDGRIQPIKFALCIIAAGAQSGQVGKLARIGSGPGLLSIPLPIEPRKRFVYCFDCKDGPGLNTPLTVDPSGFYFRREGLGGTYITGKSPAEDEEPSCENLDVDHGYFENKIWPDLAQRVPAFEALKMRCAWAGFYEYNYFDQNGIVGPHPYYTNLYIASGFSGHGIQHSPAIGRAVGEMILDGKFSTIDLTRLGFDRLVVRKAISEVGII